MRRRVVGAGFDDWPGPVSPQRNKQENETMTIEEIQTALAELVAAMVEKRVITPRAIMHVPNSGRFAIHCDCTYTQKPFDGQNYFVEHGDTIAECIDKARAYIAALPSPEEAVTREYLTRVASAIDYATENSIADEYVTPLRGVTCAMTDNLLTKE